ncbi:MAG: DEAD/DEAH box helicase [Alphaproteobacteria bacterium]|nr:DEAD/DEAH box helicase [Alphaproteobacteria bacterium]
MTAFSGLGVAEPILRALARENYSVPTPIQEAAIPLVLAGRDVLGIAQTGTGKTAAFGLPLLQRLAAAPAPAGARGVRALILAPTRELAIQIHDSLKAYGAHLSLRFAVVMGGVNQNRQIDALNRGVDVLVATPGRLLDLVAQKHVRLSAVTTFVIDEADRMFDMGFIRDVRRIVSHLPHRRQTLLFSATMPDEVARLVADVLTDPARVEISPAKITVEKIEQRVHFVAAEEKRALLLALLAERAMQRVIVFTRTKHGANKVANLLARAGHRADAIHGNKSQNARQRALDDFREGRTRVLVATDIAARGIDIDDVSHVVNLDIPDVAETYVHRIGRTARAGAGGIAVSFCDASEQESLRAIERLVKRPLTVAGGTPAAHAPRKNQARPQHRPAAQSRRFRGQRRRRAA